MTRVYVLRLEEVHALQTGAVNLRCTLSGGLLLK